MGCDLDLVGRLAAFEEGRAIRIASHQKVAIHPGAMVMSPVAMAGEDASIHVIAIGNIGSPPALRFVPDPRMRELGDRLYGELGILFWEYFLGCREAGTYPQIWLSSRPATALLDVLADALRNPRRDQMVRRFGDCLAYMSERYPVAGQQGLMTATGALRQHFVTGQSPEEDEHLGKLLLWISPPPSETAADAATRVGKTPMSTKTDPKFDRDVLDPLLRKYENARRRGDSPAFLASIERTIGSSLESVAFPIYEGIQRAIRELSAASLPMMADLPALEAKEIAAFNSFMEAIDAGFSIPKSDKPKVAARKLEEREDAEKNLRAALILGTTTGQVTAHAKGEVLSGKVTDVQLIPVGVRGRIHRVDMQSEQRVLRVRAGDRLYRMDEPRLCFLVTGVQRAGRTTTVSMRIRSGMRSIGAPSIGSFLDLAPEVPDWGNDMQIRMKINRRLATLPWTHMSGNTPRAIRKGVTPLDPLADLEMLR